MPISSDDANKFFTNVTKHDNSNSYTVDKNMVIELLTFNIPITEDKFIFLR